MVEAGCVLMVLWRVSMRWQGERRWILRLRLGGLQVFLTGHTRYFTSGASGGGCREKRASREFSFCSS